MGLLGFGVNNSRSQVIVNSDLQETTSEACHTGRPRSELAAEFPTFDFSALGDDAWIEMRPPEHHNTWMRLERFLQWCASRPEDEMVVVTHQNVCRHLLGVILGNCDVVGVTLD